MKCQQAALLLVQLVALAKKGKKRKSEDEEVVEESGCAPQPIEDEALVEPSMSYPRAKLQIKAPVKIEIGSSKHRPTGVESDAEYKKFIRSKHIYNITDPISQREPYYSPGDIIQTIYEILVNGKTD